MVSRVSCQDCSVAPVVWLCADTHEYLEGGGHFWVYLNWALGLRSLGCNVVWLEVLDRARPHPEIKTVEDVLASRLKSYGLPYCLAIRSDAGSAPVESTGSPVPLGLARSADLLINIAYKACEPVLPLFHRSVLLDIDPGLTQIFLTEHGYELAPHDLYFTIGETVGRSSSRVPSGGLPWRSARPCVSLDWWPLVAAPAGAFTTVSSWAMDHNWITFGGESYRNDKRSGFFPFLELPRHTPQRLELALCLAADSELRLDPDEDEERSMLVERGWEVVHAHAVAGTPGEYQGYIQRSRGEFSWTKPSCIKLQDAWVSDRTLCYLASGKPCVIQDTGPSRILPDSGGMHRIHDLEGAARAFELIASDYEKECRLARELAEEQFDARRVVADLLEQVL